MKKTKLLFFVVIIFISTISLGQRSNGQKLNIGFSTGTTLLKLEANYYLTKKIEVGAFYGLGLTGLAPHSYGGVGKFHFHMPARNGSVYLGTSLMLMSSTYMINAYSNEITQSEQKIGGSFIIGGNGYIGRSKRVSNFMELHFGYMPNIISYAFNSLFSALEQEENNNLNVYSWWGISYGIRIGLGK
jgi:hypothetical protein